MKVAKLFHPESKDLVLRQFQHGRTEVLQILLTGVRPLGPHIGKASFATETLPFGFGSSHYGTNDPQFNDHVRKTIQLLGVDNFEP